MKRKTFRELRAATTEPTAGRDPTGVCAGQRTTSEPGAAVFPAAGSSEEQSHRSLCSQRRAMRGTRRAPGAARPVRGRQRAHPVLPGRPSPPGSGACRSLAVCPRRPCWSRPTSPAHVPHHHTSHWRVTAVPPRSVRSPPSCIPLPLLPPPPSSSQLPPFLSTTLLRSNFFKIPRFVLFSFTVKPVSLQSGCYRW